MNSVLLKLASDEDASISVAFMYQYAGRNRENARMFSPRRDCSTKIPQRKLIERGTIFATSATQCDSFVSDAVRIAIPAETRVNTKLLRTPSHALPSNIPPFITIPTSMNKIHTAATSIRLPSRICIVCESTGVLEEFVRADISLLFIFIRTTVSMEISTEISP